MWGNKMQEMHDLMVNFAIYYQRCKELARFRAEIANYP
jgi:hypothetical protein